MPSNRTPHPIELRQEIGGVKPKFSRYSITTEQLEGWISEGKSDVAIARMLGCSQSAVEMRRNELGVDPAYSRAPVKIDRATLVLLVEQGNSDRMIAEKYGCSPCTITKRRHTYKIPAVNPKHGGVVSRSYVGRPADVSAADVAGASEDESPSDVAFRRRMNGKQFAVAIAASTGPIPKALPIPERHSSTGNSSQMCAS